MSRSTLSEGTRRSGRDGVPWSKGECQPVAASPRCHLRSLGDNNAISQILLRGQSITLERKDTNVKLFFNKWQTLFAQIFISQNDLVHPSDQLVRSRPVWPTTLMEPTVL